ncbi:MAG: protein kinase [Polyangiaceae bacterium]|nr:protein kinase [Polyangiaceae bacterium]
MANQYGPTLPSVGAAEQSGVPPASDMAAEAHAHVFAIGEVLSGAYRILRVLGEGGMGQVFEAHDLTLDRSVAVKANVPTVPAEVLRAEARATACIRHPALVAIHCLGMHRGIQYLVMERVYGASLETHLTTRREVGEPFPVPEALEVLAGVAEGLGALHRAGLAHRDLKPANIMLAPEGRIVLMDLGLGVPECVLNSPDGTVTVAGTPAYMAPESIRGTVSAGALHLVDLYAFGVIAFEVLTGEQPFTGPNLLKTLEGHLQRPAPRVRSLRAEVPQDLDDLVASLLAKSPGARPQDIEDLLWRLRSIERRSRQESDPPASRRPLSILIVDDDPTMCRLLEAVVIDLVRDAEVRHAASSAAAIEALTDRPPDVMLLDVNMPDMNGIELCMYLRGTHIADATAVVTVSAGVSDQDVRLLRQLGTHFVAKGPNLAADLRPYLRRRSVSSAAPGSERPSRSNRPSRP